MRLSNWLIQTTGLLITGVLKKTISIYWNPQFHTCSNSETVGMRVICPQPATTFFSTRWRSCGCLYVKRFVVHLSVWSLTGALTKEYIHLLFCMLNGSVHWNWDIFSDVWGLIGVQALVSMAYHTCVIVTTAAGKLASSSACRDHSASTLWYTYECCSCPIATCIRSDTFNERKLTIQAQWRQRPVSRDLFVPEPEVQLKIIVECVNFKVHMHIPCALGSFVLLVEWWSSAQYSDLLIFLWRVS